jgi:hypothetical protein
MAVGLPLKTTYADGDVYSASDVNDTNGTINTTAAPFAAGKNKIINGDFSVWQRGATSTTNGAWNYFADRFQSYNYGGTFSPSRQTFTPGSAPVAGYESQYFLRINSSLTGSTVAQPIEDVRTLAGQTATISLWAKSDSSNALKISMFQVFGSGGSGTVTVLNNAAMATLTTSWVRYSYTVAIPSISGKTVGTSSNLFLQFTGDTSKNLDVWGVQVEAGSTATAFSTASGNSIQGELAMCQRYYWRATSPTNYTSYANGQAYSSTQAVMVVYNPVPMRTGAASIEYTLLGAYNSAGSPIAITSIALLYVAPITSTLAISVASGLTAGNATILSAQNSTSAYLGFSAEM